MLIRPAAREDAAAIAQVHVQAWRETYRGIMPDAELDALSVEERTQRWSSVIGELPARRQILAVAVDVVGRVVGFAGAGAARDLTLPASGEVYAINIVNAGKRQKAGTRLMLAMADGLAQTGHATFGLWVLERNTSARAFYDRLGGIARVQRADDNHGASLIELGYVWGDIDVLRDRAATLIGESRPS